MKDKWIDLHHLLRTYVHPDFAPWPNLKVLERDGVRDPFRGTLKKPKKFAHVFHPNSLALSRSAPSNFFYFPRPSCSRYCVNSRQLQTAERAEYIRGLNRPLWLLLGNFLAVSQLLLYFIPELSRFFTHLRLERKYHFLLLFLFPHYYKFYSHFGRHALFILLEG